MWKFCHTIESSSRTLLQLLNLYNKFNEKGLQNLFEQQNVIQRLKFYAIHCRNHLFYITLRLKNHLRWRVMRHWWVWEPC